MLDWIAFALIATFAFGLQNFGYKIAAERGCNSATLMSSFIGTTIILSAVALVVTWNFSINSLYLFLAFAGINAASFVVKFILRQEALKLIPLVIGLPLSKMSAAVAAAIGILFLGEQLTLFNFAGILISMAAVWILSQKDDGDDIKDFKKGITLMLVVVLAAAIGDLAIKLASTEGNNFLFIVTTYGMMFFPALMLQERFSSIEEATQKSSLKWGIIIGVINFVSFSSLLAALQTGPMAIIFPMTTLGIALSVALSVGILKEELTRKRLTGLILALIALILLNL
ncbi:MAG: EamA family transporter [Candidatus Nanohaloarchaea archaeon]